MAEAAYLLDSNIVSDLVRNPSGRSYGRLRDVGPQRVCTSVIVACELRFGVEKRGSRRLEANLDAVLSALSILPFEVDAARHHGRLRCDLERSGRPIGGNDLLIAAQAVSLGLVLVTHNIREFGRIPDLRVEDWLAGN